MFCAWSYIKLNKCCSLLKFSRKSQNSEENVIDLGNWGFRGLRNRGFEGSEGLGVQGSEE